MTARTEFKLELPPWAQVSDERKEHIARVTTLLTEWADAMGLDSAERRARVDAGRWHDALRDAPVSELRRLAGDSNYVLEMLHGPAAAARLAQEGERRSDVLDAIRYHTVGWPSWNRTGRALYMADFLDPGRHFARPERARLASQAPRDFDAVFRQIVRMRLEWALRQGHALFPETVELWNTIR
jgi:2-amino-4-hydroxy-6-hydroxymethyldihydropteridine diphosphokinase